jgi:hypothetical protein
MDTMAANLMGAFANPLDNAAATAQRVANAAEAGGFSMPPMIAGILNAVSVQVDPATKTANAMAANSPAANVPAAESAPAAAGWKVWLTGWRLGVVLAGGVALWWMFRRGGRRG